MAPQARFFWPVFVHWVYHSDKFIYHWNYESAQHCRPAPISGHGPSSLAPRLGARARRGSRRGPPAAAARASAGGLWQPVQGRGLHVESCHGAAWPGARGAQPTGRHQSGTHFSPNAPHTHPQNPSPAGSRRTRPDTFGWAARRRAARGTDFEGLAARAWPGGRRRATGGARERRPPVVGPTHEDAARSVGIDANGGASPRDIPSRPCPGEGARAAVQPTQPTQKCPVSASWSPLGADLGGVRGAHSGRNASRMDVLPLVGRRRATPAWRAAILRIAAPGAVRRPRGCAQKKSTGLADASAREPLGMPHISMTGATRAFRQCAVRLRCPATRHGHAHLLRAGVMLLASAAMAVLKKADVS